jgi:hypothetical protein
MSDVSVHVLAVLPCMYVPYMYWPYMPYLVAARLEGVRRCSCGGRAEWGTGH